MSWLKCFLILLVLPLTLRAEEVRWTRLGIQFTADASVFDSKKSELLGISDEIADLATTVLGEIPPEIAAPFQRESLVFSFIKQASTDAVFYPPGELRKSEEFIITVNPALIHSPSFERLLAHELFHAVHYLHNKRELSWVREGLAQLFESHLYGGFNPSTVVTALTTNEFPLESDFDVTDYQREKYGNTFLFFYYLSTHCDPDRTLLWRMVTHGSTGRAGIDRILQPSHCGDFLKAAEDFSVAKIVNTYSGNSQSDQTFLIPSLAKFTIDPRLESRIQWEALGSFQPQRLSMKRALELSRSAPQDAHFWAIERRYPNRVKQITVRELRDLDAGWDIGIVRTR